MELQEVVFVFSCNNTPRTSTTTVMTREDPIVPRLVALRDLSRHHLDGIIATPRSFSQDPVYKPAPNLYEGNFRFKGFPDHAFSRPTIPRTIPGDEPVIFPPPQQPQQKAESPPPPPPAVSQRADESSAEKPTSTQQQISPPSSPKKMMDQSPPSRGSWRSRGNQQMEQQGYVPSLVEGDQMAGSRQPEWQSQPYNHNGYIENNSEKLGTNEAFSQVEQKNDLPEPATEYNNQEHTGTMGSGCPWGQHTGPTDAVPEENKDQMPESRFPWQRQQWSYNISDNKPDGNEHFGTHEPFSHRDDPLNIQEYQGPAKQPASFQDSRYPPFQEHSYRSQHQGNSRFDDQASGSPRPIPIRNAYEKTDEEIRKIEQNYIEIDREKKRLREEQRQKDMEKFAEQKKDFEMLQNYDPWGKPGAGAPRDDRRKQKFTEEQLGELAHSPNGQRPSDRYMREPFNVKPREEKQKYYNDLRDQDWQQKRMAESNRNPDMGREMGSTGMQTPPMGRHETRKLLEQRERLSELQSEVNEMKTGRESDDEDDAYRKGMKLYPRRKTYNTWDKHEMARTQTRDSFHRRREPAIGDSTYRSSYIDKSPRNDSFDPWGKGLGNPEWDPEGNITRHEHKLGKTIKNLPPNYGAHYGDFPAPDRFGKDENYPSVKYDPFDNLGRPGKALRPNYEPVRIYFPFGKSGAGAPRAYGNHRNTGTMNKENFKNYEPTFDEQQREIKRQKQRDYNSDLSMQIAEQDRNKEAMRNHLKEPQSDMAVLMYEKQVGKPRRDQYGNIAAQHHLGNSDITRSKMNRPEMDTAMQRKYHDDLKKHVWDMQAQRNLDSLKDKQGDRRHQVTFNELWGRPGNGAPKEDTRKQKLDVTIHHPTTSFSMTDEYIRSKDWSQIGDEHVELFPHLDEKNSPRFASYDESSPKIYPRSTVRSTHHNQYDYPWQVLQKKDYKVGAPYALH